MLVTTTQVPTSAFSASSAATTIAICAPNGTFSTLCKPAPAASSTKGNTSTPKSSASRLLYRGALSLPDSFLLLDGLTFTAHLGASDLKDNHKNSASKPKLDLNLLQSPLALALESMRGRPSLRFLGTVKLRDLYLDEAGDVEMDIHPNATLSRIYFENIFCLMPLASTSNTSDRSEIGVKVALGDSDGPETTEIVIFSQLVSRTNQARIRLRVARLCQRPQTVHPQHRVPRPDDPTPRKPPVIFIREKNSKRTGSLGTIENDRSLKRVGSANLNGLGPPKRMKLLEETNRGTNANIFKVPEVPESKQGNVGHNKGKVKEKDVFGDVAEVVREPDIKGKQWSEQNQILTVDENTLEKANKNVVKRAVIEYLGKTKDPTGRLIDKEHGDFKDLYNSIYRGVGFALRAKMRTCTLDLRVVDRLVDMHALMYLGGCGGSAQMLW